MTSPRWNRRWSCERSVPQAQCRAWLPSLPAGLELDVALIGAIAKSVPEGVTFGFNWRKDDGRPWIHVTRPGDPRAALNAALISLGRPSLT